MPVPDLQHHDDADADAEEQRTLLVVVGGGHHQQQDDRDDPTRHPGAATPLAVPAPVLGLLLRVIDLVVRRERLQRLLAGEDMFAMCDGEDVQDIGRGGEVQEGNGACRPSQERWRLNSELLGEDFSWWAKSADMEWQV